MFGREAHAHRIAYLDYGHSISDGMVIDHLCCQRDCANPEHLEPVTDKVNKAGGILPTKLKSECRRGHPCTAENTIVQKSGSRTCRECARQRSRDGKAKQRAA